MIHKEQLAGILIEIVLHLKIELGRTDILTVLRLPICEHEIVLHLFSSFGFLSLEFCGFPHMGLSVVFLDLFLSISFFDANINGIVFNFKFSSFIAVCRKEIDFCLLTLCTSTLLKLLV